LQVDLLSTLRITKIVVQSGPEWQYNDELATVSVCKTAACRPNEVSTPAGPVRA
jgi:hypothetical protein